MRTAPASPRAPRFHLAVNRTPTRLRPTPGACDRRWCRHARRRIWETLVRVPLAQQPSVRRGTADLCPGRQVSRAMCTRALRPPQAASLLARMRTAAASPRAPRFHLAVNRTPTRLRPTPGACDRRWCRHARRRIWETLVRVPLAQQPSVRRGTADLCPGRQVSSVQALLCRVAEARDKVFGTTSVAKDPSVKKIPR